MPIEKFQGLFENEEGMLRKFGEGPEVLDGATIHVAWYSDEEYSGKAFVLFEKQGKLYEVNGSHCSCNGLEGQWAPEETTWEALAHVVREGTKFASDSWRENALNIEDLIDQRVPLPPSTVIH